MTRNLPLTEVVRSPSVVSVASSVSGRLPPFDAVGSVVVPRSAPLRLY